MGPNNEVIFSNLLILLAEIGPGDYSTSNGNEYKKITNNNDSRE
jgi:hypothetical protein